MIYKLCRRCKTPIEYHNVYCNQCLKLVETQKEILKKQRDSKYNKNRDPKYKEFYNSKPWKLLKEEKLLKEQYKCERCSKIAVEVHHIKPIQTEEGWLLRLQYDNLEALCVRCHNFRHGRFTNYRKSNSHKIII